MVASAIGAVTLRRAGREYERERRLSRTTSALGWSAYIAHASTVAVVAREDQTTLPLKQSAARFGGAGLIGSGVVLWLAAAREFHSFAQVSGRRNEGLITSGIFKLTRNPQNLGWGLILHGSALSARSPLAMLAAAMFWPAVGAYLDHEERHLERVFGQAYTAYRSRVPRFVPAPVRAGGKPLAD